LIWRPRKGRLGEIWAIGKARACHSFGFTVDSIRPGRNSAWDTRMALLIVGETRAAASAFGGGVRTVNRGTTEGRVPACSVVNGKKHRDFSGFSIRSPLRGQGRNRFLVRTTIAARLLGPGEPRGRHGEGGGNTLTVHPSNGRRGGGGGAARKRAHRRRFSGGPASSHLGGGNIGAPLHRWNSAKPWTIRGFRFFQNLGRGAKKKRGRGSRRGIDEGPQFSGRTSSAVIGPGKVGGNAFRRIPDRHFNRIIPPFLSGDLCSADVLLRLRVVGRGAEGLGGV